MKVTTWARAAVGNTMMGMTQLMQPAFGENTQLAILKKLSLMVERESLTLTYNDVFLLIAVIYFAAVPLTLLLRKPAGPGGAGAH